ncbi:MAG: TetR/AcrR family transcriptional regulator [bacterium]
MERKPTQIRRAEIVQAAWELIMEEGVHGLTIKNICRKNNITEAAVYRHFADKHAILMALIDSFEVNLMQALDNPIRNYRNPLQRLKEVMKTHMAFTEEKKGILFAVTAESIHFNDDELRRRILDVINRYRDRIKEMLKEAKNEGLLREDTNLDAASLTFFGLIQAAIVQYALTSYTIPPISKFNTLWDIFLRGVQRCGA